MLDDIEIVEAIVKGNNKDIFYSLYKQVLPKVKRFIRNNGGNNTQAEDIFQESVVTFIMSVKEGRFQKGNSVSSYIQGIVRNKWYDLFKSKLKEEEAINQLYIENKTPSTTINKEQERTLRLLLKSIGEKCEQLIRLSIFEGYSYSEIALIVGMNNDDVVKTSTYRCRQKLKSIIKSNSNLLNELEF